MRGPPLFLYLVLAISTPAASQMTREQAREEGKALGTAARQNAALTPTDEAAAKVVPGYGGMTVPESDYFDQPARMESAAQAAKPSSEAYRIATDASQSRPTFSNSEVLATTARGTSVEADPSSYLSGEEIGAESSSCTPLPASTGPSGWYEATCNRGTQVEEQAKTCRPQLKIDVSSGPDRYRYLCEDIYDPSVRNNSKLCAPFQSSITGGICRVANSIEVGKTCLQGRWPNCFEPGDPISQLTLECDQPVTIRSYTLVPGATVVSEHLDETSCNATIAGESCEMAAEVCTDNEPQMRMINGVSVTRPCWAWERSYQCRRFSRANDCGELAADRHCTYLRTECLDEEPDGGGCQVEEQIYRCPIPGAGQNNDAQYICGDDVYCINGDCEPIVRKASTEFRDALVALHAIDQAGQEFDETNLAVFSGARETCHKPVFGLINCCAGKVSGLLTIGAGAAALAGGPTAIAAMATPFLTLFACSQDEMKLDIKDRMGFCHKLGSYCSSSFLGICKTKRTAFCCFESKLSRVLQEQGRPQLGKAWGKPKKEECKGFTIDEFARLDLSKMDFSEVYSDFIDAAKLPDEVETMIQIQQKIEDYYDLHGR